MRCVHGNSMRGQCRECMQADLAGQMAYGANQNARNEQMMRANMQTQRWPADVFERLEGERDAAVKLAATYRVALEKASDFVTRICATHEGDPEPSEREAKDLDAYIIQALGGSPSGSDDK